MLNAWSSVKVLETVNTGTTMKIVIGVDFILTHIFKNASALFNSQFDYFSQPI